MVTLPSPSRATAARAGPRSPRRVGPPGSQARRRGAVRVGITGAGDYAFRCGPLEQALSAKFTPEAARGVRIPADGLNDDIHGSAEYRAHLIPELTARAVEHCLAGTPGAII